MTLPDLTWPDLTWPDLTWPDLTWTRTECTWPHLTWLDLSWHDLLYLTLPDLTWSDLILTDLYWPNLSWPDLTRSDLAWPDITWILTGNVSKKIRKIYYPELEISLYLSNFSKEVSQLTDWQTYKKFRIIWNKCTNIPGMSPKNFRKISYPDLEISQHLCNFSKKVSQTTDWQTYKKFRIVWNKCTNIPGMSPKNFRKISHPELEISLDLSNFSKEVSQLTDWQTYKKCKTIWN